MTRPTPQPRGAWLVWIVAVAIYFLAVVHRSSMAVAGLVASERFDISAAELSVFVMLQLVLYASMQVPVGVLLDRFGSRRLLAVGMLFMTVAQTGFAYAETYPLAIACRVGVGIGDAMIFICVLRLVTAWFPARRIPIVTQITAVTGQAGALVTAAPMTWAFREFGWTSTYLVLALAGVAVTVALVLVVRDAPGVRRYSGTPMSLASVRSSVSSSWAHPGTRLGFWTHFTSQFSATSIGLLWGYPYFVRGENLSPGAAGALLSVMVVAMMLAGPVLGTVTGRRPGWRSSMVIVIVSSIVAVWTIVLCWPGDAPLWLLLVLVVIVGIGGPTSMIGFDFGRAFNPSDRQGAASGIINQGGFLASLILIVTIGVILDWRTPGEGALYTPEAFRWAMSFQYVLWSVGLTQIWRYRQRTRRLVRGLDGDTR